MRAKNVAYLLIILLLFLGIVHKTCGSSINIVTFNGVGVTIDLAFPEESHPNRTITHNVTITANTDLTLQNFTLFVYAPINSTLQHIENETAVLPMQENYSLPIVISIQLPENVNGTLYCLIYVETEIGQVLDHSSFTFYTTRVSELTFSEMQSLYDEMVENYSSLQGDFETLQEDYEILEANYNSSLANYTALLNEYNTLSNNYEAQVATYENLFNSYIRLSDNYDTLEANYKSKITQISDLQMNYDDLNSTFYSLNADYEELQALYDELNQTYNDLLIDLNNLQTDLNDSAGELNINRILMFIFVITLVALIAFIIYLKRGKEEPYVVIRKETVSMNSDKKSCCPSQM